jgi:hypothetical protein
MSNTPLSRKSAVAYYQILDGDIALPDGQERPYWSSSMALILNALGAIALGAVGWLTLEFFGRPVREFSAFDVKSND